MQQVLLQLRGVSYAVAGRDLFRELNLALNSNARLGLVGHNGCGKSTLFGLLAGRISLEQGEILRRRNLRMAEVEQFLPAALAQLNLVALLMERNVAQWQAEAMLSRFGFSETEFTQLTATLSGGQLNRLLLARALVTEPDLLLLDEPTNHMDLATLQTFEAVLAEYRGSVLTVSHDREFLDRVTTETLFLRDLRLHRFSSSYSGAKEALATQDAADAHAREAQEQKLTQLRASAKRLKTWGRDFDNEKLARKARSMEKRIAKLEEQTTEVSKPSALALDVELSASRAKQVLRVTDVAISYISTTAAVTPVEPLFHIEDLLLRPGDRLALLGANGAGKTTFIKRLVDAFADRDSQQDPAPGISLSPQTQLGYYDQALQQVNAKQSMLDFAVRRVAQPEAEVVRALIHAGFPFAVHDTNVEDLSGGERARLLFVLLSLNQPNFLILDEPTNHLDIAGKEQLEAQLLASDASLLITSHDRQFLDKVAQRYLWIHNGAVREVNSPEPFYDWQAAQGAGDAASIDGSPVGLSHRAAGATAAANTSSIDEAAQLNALAEIESLEALLLADQQRKPKFQKPLKQQAWQNRLETLYRLLED